MTASDRTWRHLLVVAAVLVGTAVVVGGVGSAGGSDGPALPGFAFDIDITVPMVSFDIPGDAGNETTRPGVSPLPVIPDAPATPEEGTTYTNRYRPA